MGCGASSVASMDGPDAPLAIVAGPPATPQKETPRAAPRTPHKTESAKPPLSPLVVTVASSPSHHGELLHSAASSTQLDVSKKSGAPLTTGGNSHPSLHQTRLSHSSKLDMLSDPTRDFEAERSEILAKVLCCRNCEDPHLPLAVWCTDCHKPGDESPPVFCDACNTDLHQFARTRSHVRSPLSSVHTTRMKTPAELGYTGTLLLPPGLPALECLACSNCDASEPSMYCTQCKTILCIECARDIHKSKLLRSHTRNTITMRFITVGFNPPKSREKGLSKRESSTKVSVVDSPAGGRKKSSAVLGLNTGSRTFMPTSSPISKARHGTKVRVRSTETTDIVPTENAGIPGDVYVFADPSLVGGLSEQLLEFRNVINPYDTIGSVQIVFVACGTDHAGFVTALGSLFMTGSNLEGQLGCGDALGQERHTKEPILVEFPRHAPVKSVACGSVHTLVLCQDSSVWSFGQGAMGKLGLVSDEDRDTPQLVTLGHWGPLGDDAKTDMAGDEEVVAIACGQNNSGCVVRGRADYHQLYIWGENSSSQIPCPLGADQSSSLALMPKLYPQLVAIHTPENKADPFPEVVSLAFGTRHVVAATKGGSVFTWGEGSFGQLGYSPASHAASDDDNFALQLTPRLVPKLYLDGVKAKEVACGERHTSVLSSTGDVWSFGSGESHQIGFLTNEDQFLPQRAVGLGPASNNVIKSIAVGSSISAAVNEAGETFLWGYGVESAVPTLVQGLKGKAAQKVAVGSNANMAFLTGTSAELYEWQFDGQPLDAEETHGTAAGEAHITNGDSSSEPCGKGVPSVNISLRGKKLAAVSSGKNHYIAVTADGKMFSWGSNYSLETGLRLPSGISYVPHPLEIKLKASIVDVKCGVEHTIALSVTGQVYTWGVGFEGRLGHISNSDVAEPRLVQTLVDAQVIVTRIAIGPSNCGVVTNTGALYLWGAGNGGQIGNDDMMPQFKPTLVKALSHVKVAQLAIGNYHACCVTDKGAVYTFGENKFGQLGLGSAFQEDHAAYPQEVVSLKALLSPASKPMAVECGDNVCLVLTDSGEVYGWGTGETMQLCRRAPPLPGAEADEEEQSTEDVTSPVRLVFPFQPSSFSSSSASPTPSQRITSLSVRDINCCCLVEDGSVYAWGWDLGEFPTKLVTHKPMGPSVSAAATLPGAKPTPKTEPLTWDRVTLGHTRMMLITP